MFSKRLLTIYELLAMRERSGGENGLLCSVAAEVVAVGAAGVALATSRGSLLCFCASNEMANNLIELEITVGEGPCHLTLDGEESIAEEDLRASRNSRWMLYTPTALEEGIRSVFGFPIRIGGIRLGVLCLYQTTPGPLSEGQFTDALLMASVIGRGIVALQAGARPEMLSSELQRDAAFDYSVHQAAGMVAVQASIDISSALVALRMHAFSLSESLSSVCARIIDRQLWFDPRRSEWLES